MSTLMYMKTTTFRMWKSNNALLNQLKSQMESKRGLIVSKNLIINESLQDLKEKLKNEQR
jgi:hypothetical protein